jgi:hypothetical protein
VFSRFDHVSSVQRARMTRYKSLDQAPASLRKLYVEQFGDAPKARRNKYGNVRTEFSGEMFDSKAEAEADQALRLKEAAGEIGGYARQVSVPMRARGGKRMVLDFLVNKPHAHRCSRCGHEDRVMKLTFVDRKGMITPEWETKRRLLEAQLGVAIEVVTED